jgi:hypothetical protein
MLALIYLIRESEDSVTFLDVWKHDREEDMGELETRLISLHNDGLLFIGDREYSNRKPPPYIDEIDVREKLYISPKGHFMLENGV